MNIEKKIIEGLLDSEQFIRKAGPYLDPSYFTEKDDHVLINVILDFFKKYNKIPSIKIVKLNVSELSLSEELHDSIEKFLDNVGPVDNLDWLLDKTEKFCLDKSIYNGILESLSIIEGTSKQYTQEAIPGILQKALSVSFDPQVGHSYFEDAEARFLDYTKEENKLPFDLTMLNAVTDGGLPPKGISVFLAASGVGKSLVMCHFASSYIRMGKNVLYITMEMAEEKIAERIDANLMNVDIQEIKKLSSDIYSTKIHNIEAKNHGKLFIKEYPTGAAHSGHFRALIEELKAKKGFKPDVLIVDYLGITASARVKMSGSINSYQYLKNVAEELRGLGVENDIPVITAGQVNRSAFGASDFELSEIAESAAIVHTADLIMGIIRTEELDTLNQVMFKTLKNRYGDVSNHRRFVVGIDRAKMKLYDLEQSAQANIVPDVIRKSATDYAKKAEVAQTTDRKDFSTFKF